MHSFYIIVYDLLMPPVGFLTLALLGLALSRRWLVVCGLVLLLLSALPIVPSMLFLSLESGLELGKTALPDMKPPQAIVVLGGDVQTFAPTGGILGGVQPGPLSAGRIMAAARLSQAHDLPILLTGGGGWGTPVADMMRKALVEDYHVAEAQIPPDWIERRARDTWENAEYAAAILHAHGVERIYLVTDGWHMRRALIAFRRAGLQAWPAPVALTWHPDPLFSDFLPRSESWRETYFGLHEWLGCAYYVLRD